MGPAYRQLESAEAIAAAKADAEGALLLAYLASNTSKEFKTFAQVAEALRNGEVAARAGRLAARHAACRVPRLSALERVTRLWLPPQPAP